MQASCLFRVFRFYAVIMDHNQVVVRISQKFQTSFQRRSKKINSLNRFTPILDFPQTNRIYQNGSLKRQFDSELDIVANTLNMAVTKCHDRAHLSNWTRQFRIAWNVVIIFTEV